MTCPRLAGAFASASSFELALLPPRPEADRLHFRPFAAPHYDSVKMLLTMSPHTKQGLCKADRTVHLVQEERVLKEVSSTQITISLQKAA